MSEPSPGVPAAHKPLFDAAVYTFGNTWSAAFGALASLVTRTLVSVTAFGANNFVQGITGYFDAYNGLYRNAIGREVPANLGLGKHEGADEIVRASYTMLLASVGIQSAVLFVLGILIRDRLLKFALLTGAFLNIVDSLKSTDQILMRSTQRFRAVAVGHLLTGIFSPALLVLLSWVLRAEGYFLGLAAGGALRFIGFRILLRRGPLAYLTWRLRGNAIRQVVATGVTISLLSLAGQALLTADRWVIVGFLGTKELGYYSLGSSIVVSLGHIPLSIAGSYFPTLMGLAATGQLERVARGINKVQASVTLLLVLLFGTVALVIGPAVKTFLPEYEPSVLAFQVMCIQGYLYGAQAVSIQSYVALGRVWHATLITAACAGLAFLLSRLLVHYGLLGVAVAMATAFGLCAILVNWSAQRFVGGHGLLGYMLLGLAMLAMLYTFLFTVGLFAAWAYLLGVGGGAGWYLTRLLGIEWRALPSSTKAYLFGGAQG